MERQEVNNAIRHFLWDMFDGKVGKCKYLEISDNYSESDYRRFRCKYLGDSRGYCLLSYCPLLREKL